MIQEYPITLEELETVNVLTAPEMGFMLDDGGKPIFESRYTLAQILFLAERKVKFILAKNAMPVADMQPSVHLGIFYPTQSAATSAHVLCHYIAGKTDKFPELAQKNAQLCYGRNPHVEAVERQSKLIQGTTLIGGGEIHTAPEKDTSSALTLQTNFGLQNIPREHMSVVRRIVLRSIGA